MQIYADVFGVPVRLVSNENAVSVGAGIMAAITYKTDNKKDKRSKLVHKNFSWENVVKKLKKEFENKLSK